MAFLGSFTGSTLLKGIGGYHPGIITQDISPSQSANSVVATSTLSTTATGSTNPMSALSITSVNVTPRVPYDPFGAGPITQAVLSTVASGTVSKVESNNVFISFASGTFASLSAGMPIRFAGYGASQGGGMYGTFYIVDINSGSGYITVASSYANYVANTKVLFSSASVGNASGYTWTPTADQPTWVAGGGLPPGMSFNTSTGAITGSYTYNNPGINPTANTGGVTATGQGTSTNGPTGSVNATYNNYYAARLQPTTYNGFADPNIEIFNVAVSIPYEFRQILTTCYTLGGYSSSTPYTNVNRTTGATDTNVDIAASGRLTTSQAYQFGVWSWNYVYCFGANNTVSTASNTTIAWSMRSETARTTNFSATWYDSVNSNSCVQQEHYYAWITAGTTIREFNLSTETNNGTPTNQTGSGSQASGASHETRGIFNSANVSWAYATRTGTARTATAMSSGGNAKILQNKNPTTNQWGSNGDNKWRYTNFPSDTTTTSTTLGIPGTYTANEENHCNVQDWGYCVGFYNPSGHQASSYKWIFASQTGSTGTSNYVGQTANSSGWPANRD